MIERAKSIILILTAIAAISLMGTSEAEVKGTYLYNLSDFAGIVPTTSAKISIDNVHKEVYLITGDIIRVFNASGMEIYSFGEDLSVGVFYDAATDPEGNIYLLSFSYKEDREIVTLCNYRGEPVREIKLTNIPPEFEGSRPNRMIYRNGTLYFVLESKMKVFMTDVNGVFKDAIDLFPLMDIQPERSLARKTAKGGKPEEVKRSDYGIDGFYVDPEGNMLFTSPITAVAYIVSPDRKVESFGKRGSAPGKFSVPRGIARDKSGNYFVSDILRCVVMIFNSKFDFINEFGYRGWGPGNLIGPTAMAVDDDSRLYVTQLMDRGVSVFKIEGN
jgi:hypothetical protein